MGNKLGIIKEYNSRNNVKKGVFFTAFNILTNTQKQLQDAVNSISDITEKVKVEKIILLVIALIGLAIKIFITNPLLVGECRIYLESVNYKKTKIKRIVYPFKKGRYLNTVFTIFLMKLFKLLWNLTIIGGLIKNYSYKMVSYIEAENPNIKSIDAIKISEIMMNGNKWQTFKLDLTFLGWWILEYATFGLAGIYVTPYIRCTYTELYMQFEYLTSYITEALFFRRYWDYTGVFFKYKWKSLFWVFTVLWYWRFNVCLYCCSILRKNNTKNFK